MRAEHRQSATDGRARGFALTESVRRADPPPSKEVVHYRDRNRHLEDIPGHVIRRAWFNMAHLLLQPGAKVLDMGCVDGAITHAMAIMHPEIHFTGIDLNKKLIAKARHTYKLANLDFVSGNISGCDALEPESFDAVINSFILHEVYSGSRFNDRQVARTLDYHFTLLKNDGLMFVRDFALRYPGEYVLIEMPDASSGSPDPARMSETELLLWYAERARSKEDPGCHGFFMEELPPRMPQTRLFRLPYKWAYEFIIRKDNRENLRENLHKEYTYFTEREFRKTLRGLGARVLYTAPHWDEKIIDKSFTDRFRMLDDDGTAMGPPPTSFIAIAQKIEDRKSLVLGERRPSSKPASKLRITAMRNEKNGRIVDIVTREMNITEVLPYRVGGDGQLRIFVHEGLPRGLVNAVPRVGKEIDGKRWSGHMVEAISVPSEIVTPLKNAAQKETIRFSLDYLGLKPVTDAQIEEGTSYYPAPDYIDDLIQTAFLHVTEQEGPIEPKAVTDDVIGFMSSGHIREVRAQAILDAIAVGLIPNARLEMQILDLCHKLEIDMETWEESPLNLDEIEPEPELEFNPQEFSKLRAAGDARFKDVRGATGQLRAMQSIFVEEGWVEGGASGLASRDIEFVIPEEKPLSRAAIVPLSKKSGDFMIGFEVEYLPVPQRHQGNGLTARVPSVTLPKEITNAHQAKKYVADLFKVPMNKVWRLGEGYFCHIGVTPQRVYTFAVAASGRKESPISGPIQYAPMKYMWDVIGRVMFDWKADQDFAWAMRKSMRFLADGNDFRLRHALGQELRAALTRPDPVISDLSSLGGLTSASSRKAAGVPERKEVVVASEKKTEVEPEAKAEDLSSAEVASIPVEEKTEMGASQESRKNLQMR